MENNVETVLKEQFNEMPDLLHALLADKSLMELLIAYHQPTFVELFDKFHQGKDKYLRFQVEWYNHCSFFLTPRQENEVCEAKIAWTSFVTHILYKYRTVTN